LVTQTGSIYVNASSGGAEWDTPINEAQWKELVNYILGLNSSFIDKSPLSLIVNYINGSNPDIIYKSYYSGSDGILTEHPSAFAYPLISVEPGDIVRFSKLSNSITSHHSGCFFDETDAYIGSLESEIKTTIGGIEYFEAIVPSGCTKIGCNFIGPAGMNMLTINQDFTDNAYNYNLNKNLVSGFIDKNSIPNDVLKCFNNAFGTNKDYWNIFDKFDYASGFLDQTGTLVNATTFDVSGFIPVTPGTILFFNYFNVSHNVGYGGGFYNSGKTWIGNISLSSINGTDGNKYYYFVVPSNCEFVRVNILLAAKSIDAFMLLKKVRFNSNQAFDSFTLPAYLDYSDNNSFSDEIRLSSYQEKQLIDKATYHSFSGKRIISFGDSLAYGAGNGGVGYIGLMKTLCKFGYSGNYGMNGATITPGMHLSTGGELSCISTKVNTTSDTADFVLLEGGINDFHLMQITPETNPTFSFGSITNGFDPASLNTATFCGAFENMLYLANTKWPSAKKAFIIIHRSSFATFGGDWDTIWIPAMIKMCNKWGIGICDLTDSCPPFGMIDSLASVYTSDGSGGYDGLHPNDLGYQTGYIPNIIGTLMSGTVKWTGS